jgi:hypothetical protein
MCVCVGGCAVVSPAGLCDRPFPPLRVCPSQEFSAVGSAPATVVFVCVPHAKRASECRGGVPAKGRALSPLGLSLPKCCDSLPPPPPPTPVVTNNARTLCVHRAQKPCRAARRCTKSTRGLGRGRRRWTSMIMRTTACPSSLGTPTGRARRRGRGRRRCVCMARRVQAATPPPTPCPMVDGVCGGNERIVFPRSVREACMNVTCSCFSRRECCVVPLCGVWRVRSWQPSDGLSTYEAWGLSMIAVSIGSVGSVVILVRAFVQAPVPSRSMLHVCVRCMCA